MTTISISHSPIPAHLSFVTQQLTAAEWRARRDKHRERFAPLLQHYVKQRSRGNKDPVLDFLFEYYNMRAGTLKRWTPGVGVLLTGPEVDVWAEEGFTISEAGAHLDPHDFPKKRIHSLVWVRDLLHRTQQRAPFWGCYGLHEWAMVYRSEDRRHQQFPLRLDNDTIADFVDSRSLCCTHFDAYRFFTPAAKPKNRYQMKRIEQPQFEQPGCLHSNMDLYKWAYKLRPWAPGEILGDAFALAYEARKLDMRASPYDLRAQGLTPIAIETEAGRDAYQQAQRCIHEQAKPVRQALIEAYDAMLQALAQCGIHFANEKKQTLTS